MIGLTLLTAYLSISAATLGNKGTSDVLRDDEPDLHSLRERVVTFYDKWLSHFARDRQFPFPPTLNEPDLVEPPLAALLPPASPRTFIRRSAQDLHQVSAALLVLGDSGAGKNRFLFRLGRLLLSDNVPNSPIPLYLSLGNSET